MCAGRAGRPGRTAARCARRGGSSGRCEEDAAYGDVEFREPGEEAVDEGAGLGVPRNAVRPQGQGAGVWGEAHRAQPDGEVRPTTSLHIRAGLKGNHVPPSGLQEELHDVSGGGHDAIPRALSGSQVSYAAGATTSAS